MSRDRRCGLSVQEKWRYTDAEWERLQIRHAPWIIRPFWYFVWLVEIMPTSTGGILFFSGVLLCACLIVGFIAWVIVSIAWVCMHAAWVFWLVLGAGVALVARLVLRDAAAAELSIQRSLAAKEHQEIGPIREEHMSSH